MKNINLKNGLSVSPICLGAMMFGSTVSKEDAYAVLDTFVGMGGAIGLHLWANRKSAGDMVSLTIVYYVSGIFFALYVAAAVLFILLSLISFPFVVALVTEIILTIAYVIAVIYALGGANYIRKEQKHTKEKVMYIRLLKVDVDDCAIKATSDSLRKALGDLSESVRYSDPMSHPSLAGIEAELSSIVADISSKIDEAAEEEALALVAKAKKRLEMRNNRCLMLK